MVNVKVGGGDGGGGGESDAQQHDVEASRGDPPQHPIGFQLSGNSRGFNLFGTMENPRHFTQDLKWLKVPLLLL